MFFKISIVSFMFFIGSCRSESYFWRHWNGTVPTDAVIVGQDDLGRTYVAKVYVPAYGLYIAGLSPHQKEVGVHVLTTSGSAVAYAPKSSNTIEVLCTDDLINLTWMATNNTRTTLYLQENQIIPVLGGRTSYYSNNPIYIGKNIVSGRINLGSVHNNNIFYYARDSITYSSTSYELLIQLQ